MGLAVVLMCTNIVLAKDDKAKQPPAPAQPAPTAIMTQQEKDLLIANINAMRTQELRVAVLKQLSDEESAKLQGIQAAFCDKYKLDVNKFREGLYRYDDKAGKFIEAEPPKPPQPAK